MKTNQLANSFKRVSLICVLISGLWSFGQTESLDFSSLSYNPNVLINFSSNLVVENDKAIKYTGSPIRSSKDIPFKDEFTIWIKSMTYDGRDTSKVSISYAKKGELVKPRTVSKDQQFPSDTYFEIPEKTEVTLTSKHGQETTLIAGSKSSSVITENSQNHCTWWGRIKHRILNPSVPYSSCGKSKRHTMSARGTVFTVAVDGNDVLVEREEGKIEMNERIQVNLNEALTVNSEEKRELFVTERSFLNAKKKQKSFSNDSLQVKHYDSSEAIESFFKEQLIKAKNVLRKSGRNSKAGFKYLNQGELDKGLDHYKKAVLTGEMDRNVFIQSALLLTEGYHITGELKNKSIWLEAAFEFIEIEYEINELQYKHYNSIGAPEAARGYKDDFAVATEYFAWAYTVKLKLAGCLENTSQNPLKWRERANDIKGE